MEAGTFFDVWSSGDGSTEITLIDDRPIGSLYFEICGPGAETAAGFIRKECRVREFTECLSDAEDGDDLDQRLLAIYAVALTAGHEQLPQLVTCFRSLSSDPSSTVRESVVIAASYVPVPEILDVVSLTRQL